MHNKLKLRRIIRLIFSLVQHDKHLHNLFVRDQICVINKVIIFHARLPSRWKVKNGKALHVKWLKVLSESLRILNNENNVQVVLKRDR